MAQRSSKTSWGGVADWYDELLERTEGTYQQDVVLPNLSRCLALKPGERVLDLACGQGFFSRAFAEQGASVVGVDVARELIEKARTARAERSIEFHIAPADRLDFLPAASFDVCAIVLAIQNISNPHDVFRACERVLKTGGRFALVLNHPAFRIPKASDWGWDEEKGIQFRRVDRYLSEFKSKIQMHPGAKPDEVTLSYHRPMQFFVKTLARSGFSLVNMEEWVSNRKSDSGPRADAENLSRAEIPLFLYLEARKN